MKPDGGSRALHRIGLVLFGFWFLGFAASVGLVAVRAIPTQTPTALIAGVGAFGLLLVALQLFRYGVRGDVPQWWSEFVRNC